MIMIIIPMRAAERIVLCYYDSDACYIFSSIVDVEPKPWHITP
jgi:hypothetical protein